jgi:hypothetical protein
VTVVFYARKPRPSQFILFFLALHVGMFITAVLRTLGGKRPPFWPDSEHLFDLVNQLKKAPHGPHSLLFHHVEVLDEEMELFLKRRNSLPVLKGPKADPFKLKLLHLSVAEADLFPHSIGAAKMAGLHFSTCLAWQVDKMTSVRNSIWNTASCPFDSGGRQVNTVRRPFVFINLSLPPGVGRFGGKRIR